MITCQRLLELLKIAQNIGIGLKELLSISLLLKEGYGRVAIAKRLKFRERLVRDIIKNLRGSNAENTVIKAIGALSKDPLSAPWLTCKPVVYSNVGDELIRAVLVHVVSVRDYIVINSGNPGKVEVIGVVNLGKLEYPGLPPELADPYIKLATLVQASSGILICWKNYVEHVDDAVFLASLTNICGLSVV